MDFGVYGKYYVSDPFNYKNLLWVTSDEKDCYNANLAGWSMPKKLAVRVLTG